MEFGICNLTIVPLRAEESHRSEMISQLLFGEAFEILTKSKDWTKVRTEMDSYVGWIQNGQFLAITDDQYEEYQSLSKVKIGFDGGHLINNDLCIQLLHGTIVRRDFPYIGVDHLVELNAIELHFEQEDFIEQVAILAKQYWDVPYLWGGRSKFGIDCSGFSQLIYQSFGISLPRDAYQQVELGQTVDFLSEIQVGDLAFFDNEEGRINHVGIMLDSETIIHASSRVRIDRMDQEGIFNRDWNKYTHKLRIIKRYV
ncbi:MULTISPECIES: C40 family peptidase [unclassified Sphingobacterium]|uniref:C40 family peptidase n=1 Tax=unclassified Sphingobacterium TaxID=2609468 RepID=UPI00104FA523|nr:MULTISPECIES: C40 family peptidase [unclassified Sphingobacterium]MCS3557048.1 cell wall-associated NlpC family hydrolase [Sphingobacterium sp. JUb21]TCQ98091.1 SH3 domain-containing protein [Sphingobacterium sp. JUb20]